VTVFRRNRSLLIPSQKADLVFERLSLFYELSYHPILPKRKWDASPPACLNDFARQLEQRCSLSLFMRDYDVVPHRRLHFVAELRAEPNDA
jgi:hypothetical protein